MADLAGSRIQIATAERQITALGARIRQETAALEQLQREGKTVEASARRQSLDTLKKQRSDARAALQTARQSLEALRQNVIATAAAQNPIGALDSSVPIALFPVRLETRFRAAGAGKELLIRVFPDDVHIDTHEPELTEDESDRGRRYWTQIWRSGTGTAESVKREGLAWAQLADFCGPERGAWVARSLEPKNLPARPATPIDDVAPLTVAPDFPAPPQRESSWTRRPYAAALPDRWIALGYSTERRAFMAMGSLIPDRLTVGPAPDNDGPAQSGDALQLIDEEMRWLVDFDAAVKNGMALRVPLPEAVQNGISTLIVFGVKASMDSKEAAAAAASLLEGHHYTRGLSFLMRGTPTNNTTTAPSGYGSRDPGHERSFAAERQGPLFKPGSGTAGDLSARALGLDPAVFMNCWKADDSDNSDAGDLNTALWPATWGYYLEKRLAGYVSDENLARVRSHFIRYVRGGGPLPALRLRNQPYGLLPVTALDLWAPAEPGDVEGRALTALLTLQDFVARAVPRVPRLGSDPDQDLLAVLRMSPLSVQYAVRHMVGPLHVDNFFSFAGADINAAWWSAQAFVARTSASVPGLPPNTPQSTAVFSIGTQNVGKPLVGEGSQDYLKALAAADVTNLRNNTVLPAGQRPLLYDLARHGLLLAYAGAAYRMQLRAGITNAGERVEPELVDINRDGETPTVWRQLERKIAGVTGAQTLREFLSDSGHESNADVSELAEVRKSLRDLAAVPPDKLEMLLRETLDTASHRLDAWATSLATRRLDLLRTRKPTGLLIGGYGWVEDLKPSAAPRSDGYVQTPSLAHATTAAILASGYLAHRGEGGANPFAVDLSSERVRLAYRLIEGVRTGQPVGALLGYQIERELHDQQLSIYVAQFRKLAPLASTPTTGTAASEAVAANNVVHGIRILEMWNTKHPSFQALRTSVNIADFQKIDILFRKIADQVDALGDVILADNVHEVAEGNFDRSSLTLSAVLAGQSIPEPEVLRTPRTGTGLNHRVLALLDAAQLKTPAWPTDALQARAAAEPRANVWAASLLGDPAKIRCRAQYVPGDAATRVVKLSDLKLSPLDAIYITANSGDGENSELEQRLRYQLLRTRPAGVPADAAVKLDYSRDPQFGPDIVSFDEFLAIANAVRALLSKSRPLTAADLAPTDQNAEPAIDAAELRARADAAVTAFRAAQTRLRSSIAGAAPLEPIRAALIRLLYLGLNNAVPVSAVDGAAGDARLRGQATAALADVTERLAKIDAMIAAFARDTAKPEAILEFETERLRVIFGADFQVLPQFKPPNPEEVKVAFANSDALQRNRRLEVVSWFTRVSRVREALGRLADVLRLAEAFGRPAADWTVGQMPLVPGESWVALPLVSGTIPGSRLSLVVCGPLFVDASQPLAGIVFDEWSEVVPSRAETTAMAFHYDRPGARSPQAILLAVAPDTSKPWDLLTMEQLLRETLNLCRWRLVDQDAMLELDHFLPALCFPINAAGDTIAVDVRAE